MRALLCFVAFAFVACSSTTSTPDTGSSDAQDALPQPDGGVCCPYTTSCSCLGGGGWAADQSSCPSNNLCAADGRWGLQNDSHGCPVVVTGTGPNCCGCPPADAGGD